MALVASAWTCPYCPNQLKEVGSDVSVSSWEGSGCRVGELMLPAVSPCMGKSYRNWEGLLLGAVPPARVPEHCTVWSPGMAGGEMKGESSYSHCNQHSGWRHTHTHTPQAWHCKGKTVGVRAGHSWLSQSLGRGPCLHRGLLWGSANCMTQARMWIKGCGSLVATPPPHPAPIPPVLLPVSAPGKLR